MEFGQKLQELRKNRNLTQEELAQALYVSRTAVSKWESGRGYPSIDSLKEVSKFFSVSIDDLLSGDKLLSLAQTENRANIRKLCDRLLAAADLFAFLLIVLPLYPKTVDGFVCAVSLPAYTETTPLNRGICWIMVLLLVLTGILKLLPLPKKAEDFLTAFSMAVSIGAVLFLALAGETYAVMLVFLLLVCKGLLLFRMVSK